VTLSLRVGRYEAREKLGEGTLAQVFLAHDTTLLRDVVVKILRTDLPEITRTQAAKRISREVRAAAALGHPNICILHDCGEDPNVGIYWVMEHVRGVSLRSRIHEGPVPLEEIVQLAREMGSALSYAHETGTLHRDLKPENVLLDRFGTKVMDFCIGRIPDLDGIEPDASSMRYTSPEARERSSYTARNDQFSFATLLQECLTGRLVDKNASEQDSVPSQGIPLGLESRLDAILARGRSLHAEDRYPSCRDLGDAVALAIEASLQGGPLSTRLSLSGPGPSLALAHAAESIRPSASEPEAKAPAPPRGQNIILGFAVAVLIGLMLLRSSKDRDAAAAREAARDAIAPVSTPLMNSAPQRPKVRPKATAEGLAAEDAGSD
jgi:serine/threonine protein kinase